MSLSTTWFNRTQGGIPSGRTDPIIVEIAPLGSYETVAFAASMAILWVIVVLHEVGVQFTTVIVAFVFCGLLTHGFGHFSWFLRIFANEWFACGENLFWVIFAKIHQL